RWCRVRLPRPTRCLLEPPGLAGTTLATSRLRVQKHALADPWAAALGSAADYSLLTLQIGAVALAAGHSGRAQAGYPRRADPVTGRIGDDDLIGGDRPPPVRQRGDRGDPPVPGAAMVRRADLDANHHPALAGVQGRAQRPDGLREHARGT